MLVGLECKGDVPGDRPECTYKKYPTSPARERAGWATHLRLVLYLWKAGLQHQLEILLHKKFSCVMLF